MLRNPRLFRSSSKENILFIGLVGITLSTGRIDDGLLSRNVLENVLVSVCDDGVAEVSISSLSGGMIYGRELVLSSMILGDYVDIAFAFVAGKYIFRFESNLIDSAAACSNISCTILSLVGIWNLF